MILKRLCYFFRYASCRHGYGRQRTLLSQTHLIERRKTLTMKIDCMMLQSGDGVPVDKDP